MHNAPPVTYPLGRSHFQGLALLGLWLAGVGVLTLWWRVAPVADWRLWTALAVVLAAGVAAGWAWLHSPVGQLCWDGQDWRWESQGYQAGTPVRDLVVALDLQRTLLLRLENQDHATLWLWAGRSTQPERWLDLRRAVHSQHRPSADPVPWDASPSAVLSDFPAQSASPRSGS
jgi:hypothetical protein